MLDDYKKITNDFKDLNMLKMLHIDLGARKKSDSISEENVL